MVDTLSLYRKRIFVHAVKKLMDIRISPVSEIVYFSLLFLILCPYLLFNHSL
jgi:hypothetical protein